MTGYPEDEYSNLLYLSSDYYKIIQYILTDSYVTNSDINIDDILILILNCFQMRVLGKRSIP